MMEMTFLTRLIKKLAYFSIVQVSIIVLLINLSDSLLYCKCNDHHKCLSNENGNLGNLSNFYCVIRDKGHCFAARVTVIDQGVQPPSAHIVKRYGCLSTDTKSILSCKGHYFNSTIPVAIACCNKTTFCNSELHPKFYNYASDEDAINYARAHLKKAPISTVHDADTRNTSTTKGTIMMAACVFILFICVSVCIAVVCVCRQRLHWASKRVLRAVPPQESALLPVATAAGGGGSLMTASSLLTTVTTGSRLTQRTLGHQVLFQQLLGRGRFSEVWAGEWLGEPVAVRHLHSQAGGIVHEQLWLRTVGLYFSWPLQHAYVAALLGSDKAPLEASLCPCPPLALLLIYPYYHWGSLASLMGSSHWDLSPGIQTTTSSRLDTLARMALSLVSGLCYLHTEIAATKGKPAIAHRNLKPSNVYVKDDYSCCIGDLEWALAGGPMEADDHCSLDCKLLSAPNGLVQYPDFEYVVSNVLVASGCRYVAPELLENSDPDNRLRSCSMTVDEYKKCDIYSLGLILWELLVWFEPSLKQPQPTPLASDPAALPSLSDWVYEPAYQTPLASMRRSLSPGTPGGRLYDDPRPAEMRHLVITQAVRPFIDLQRTPQSPQPGAIVPLLCQIVPQCWGLSPDSRLSSLKIKKYLSQLSEAAPIDESV